MAHEHRGRSEQGTRGDAGRPNDRESGKGRPENSERSPNELDQTDESQKAADITNAGARKA